jgi:hypothetical protein
MKAFRPLFVIVAFLLMVGLACSFGGAGTESPPDPPTQQDQPTQEQEEQPTSEGEEEATEEPDTESSEGEQFFTDTFDGDMDNYSVKNLGTGKEDNMDVNVKDGYMVFDLKGENLWVYVTYNPFTYKDVKISVTADNRGKNNNNVSLICRKSDEGWYEFNIANNGLYNILAYIASDNTWYNIYNGGSTAIKQGKDVNEYTVSCADTELALSINGVDVKKIKDSKYKLREGNVGFSVSSFDVTPILVEVDSFTISEP